MKAAYLWLSGIKGLGPVRGLQIIEKSGGIDNLWNGTLDDLISWGLSSSWARRMVNSRQKEKIEEKLEKTLKEGIEIVSFASSFYPKDLKEIHDPPLVLYVKGNLEALKEDKRAWIGIVGTRKPSPYGEKMTKALVTGLCQNQVGIVSGLAKGIDGIAHETALKEKGYTIAVLGNGCNVVYPKSNKRIYEEIVECGGVLLSEFEPDQAPLRHHFPRRNRLISGLSKGVLVVEAGEKSGSLITARYAADQGRQVMCLPTNVTSPLSKGGLSLLREGAFPVSSAEDILSELNVALASQAVPKERVATTLEKSLALIEPATADQLADILGEDVKTVMLQLTYLEVKGRIRRRSGGFYICV